MKKIRGFSLFVFATNSVLCIFADILSPSKFTRCLASGFGFCGSIWIKR
jgi:hypothetical protein